MSQSPGNRSLSETDLDADPLVQLERWLDDARKAGIIEPTAMALATAASSGRPSVRIVLYKGSYDGGLSFYTNYESRKGQELAANPNVELCFWWDRPERQVRVAGRAERLPREVSARYFAARPRESRIAAVTSRQSRVAASRAALEARYEDNAKRFEGRAVPCPEFWGGYVVRPQEYEFWQGRSGRFHDRLRYRRDGGGWKIERLEP